MTFRQLAPRVLLWLFIAANTGATEPAPGEWPTIVGLEGEWYVLVHYGDESGDVSKLTQWHDRVWRFERESRSREEGEERLRWTILSGVRFRDARGRFEAPGGGRSARSLGAWEPDARQIAEIRTGLQTDDHGARSKLLRGSPASGYRSSGQASARSSSTIGYRERWQIDGLPGAPVFVREDSMGSGRTDELKGRTRFTTREIAPGGDELTGDFDRDGVLVGRFRMWRMGGRGAGG
jgi:hypothetical protein